MAGLHALVTIGIEQHTLGGDPNNLLVTYSAEVDYTDSGANIWNSQVFTLRWPVALGSAAVIGMSDQAAFSFAMDGGPADGGDGFFYQKIVSSATNVALQIESGEVLPVLLINIAQQPVPVGSFELVEAPNAWVLANNGQANVENAVLGEQFQAFDPASAPDIALSAGQNAAYPSEVVIFPNPTTGQVLLEWYSESGGAFTLAVFSEKGTPVLRRSGWAGRGVNRMEMDLSGIPPAVYLIKVFTPEKTIEGKLAIQK